MRRVDDAQCLVDFLLLVDTKLAGAHVDEEEETAAVGLLVYIGSKGRRSGLTQWTGSGRSRILQNPFAGGVRGAMMR